MTSLVKKVNIGKHKCSSKKAWYNIHWPVVVFREKTPYEKAQSEVSNPSMLSVKTSQTLANSPKRGQKKEDGWKEVIRK